MSVINATPLLAAAGGDYQISRSVRLRSSASAYFNRTNGTPTSGTTWTISFWMKRGSNLGTQQNIMGAGQTSGTNYFQMSLQSDNALNISDSPAGNSLITTQVFRDPSAWYHIVYAFDSTQATASNRVKLYVNGTQITAFSTAVYPALNAVSYWNTNAYVRAIGNIWYNGAPGGFYFDGYLTEINFIDGQALTPSSFGETDSITGVWKPKKYAGTYGTNGFYLNFSDNSAATAAAIGKDYSGNGNNWTPNNISVTAGVTYDSMLDVPTLWADGGNGRGNYCVINPLDVSGSGVATLSNANLKATGATSAYRNAFGTLRLTSGSFYFETTVDNFQTDSGIGIKAGSTEYLYLFNGNKTNGTSTAFGSTWTTGDVIGVAFDATNGKVWWSKNGTWQASGDPAAGTNAAFTFTGGQEIVADAYLYGTTSHSYNFGQRPFAYTPPTGFKALNTQNLPEPTIKKGNQYFNTVLYTGNGSTNNVTGVGFQPDFVWLKARSAGGFDHVLQDVIRGSTRQLYTNTTDAEVDDTDAVTSFNADGFTSGADVTTNNSGTTFVAWNWKESPSAGFDIVTYTGNGTSGRTIAHDLGVAPRMIFVKRRDTTLGWVVGATSIGWTNQLELNSTVASTAYSGWNNTAPSSSVFTVGSNGSINASGGTYVAYLFAEVAGFSRFGSYTGNGSADGPFQYLGFKPRFILIKRTDAVDSWRMYDSARNSYNAGTYVLYPNLSNAEDASVDHFDWLSNGFKTRSSSNNNASGGTYIYAAFAENPAKYALAR